MGLGSFLRNPIKNAPGMNQAKKLINKAPGVSQANKLLGKVPGATKMLNKGPAGEMIPGSGTSGGQVGRSPSGPPQFQNPNGMRAQFYNQTGIVPPRTGGGGGPAATGGWGRNPSALPLGGQGIAAMVRPWEQGGIGNQPGQPPMSQSQFPPQMNRPPTQYNIDPRESQGFGKQAGGAPTNPWGPGGRMDMGPEASRWGQQLTGQMPPGGQNTIDRHPAWMNPSLPPQGGQQGQGNPAWQNPSLPWDPQQGGGGMRQTGGFGMNMDPRTYDWNGGGQMPPQQNKFSAPPQMGGNGMGAPGWQGGGWQMQQGPPQGGPPGMNRQAVMPPNYQGGGYKGMPREQMPNPAWGGGGSPQQQYPGMNRQGSRMLF